MEYFRRTADLPPEQLVNQIHELSKEVGVKFNADNQEMSQLERFSKNAKRLSDLANKSDFPGVPANTYRSTLRLMVHILMAAVEKMSSEKDKEDLFTIVSYGNKWMEEIDTIEKNSAVDGNYTFGDSRRIYQMFLDDGVNSYHAFLNPHLGGVNLITPFQYFSCFSIRMWTISLQFSNRSVIDAFKTFFGTLKTNYVADVIAHQTVKVPKRILDFCSNYCPTLFKIGSFFRSPLKFVFTDVQHFSEDIISQYEIHIDPDTGAVDVRKRTSLVTKKINYYVIKSSGTDFENQVVFFVHGGAFLGPTAEPFNYGLLDDLAYFLPGVTIVNIDISSSIDGRFPGQLQEVLDLYVRLFSTGRRRKKSPIPHFRDIVLFGESSGGSLVTSLTIVLNDLRRKMYQNFSIQMPRSLVPLYARLFVRIHVDPSQLLMQWADVGFLNVYTFRSLGEAYVAYRKRDSNGNWYLISHEETPPKDWMWRTDECKPVDHPYVSPATYSDWDSLSDVELHAVTMHMDGLLHDTVYLARKWKGKVNLVVLDGLPHAFPYFAHCPGFAKVREAKREVFTTVRKALGWNE